MKLVRYGEPGRECPGIWLDATDSAPARIVDVRAMVFDIEDYNTRFWNTFGLARLRGLLRESALKTFPAEGIRLGPPIARPSQVICLGKNYRDHAEEFDAEVPNLPIYFSKNPNSLCGTGDILFLHPDAHRVDAEVELAVVIARRARNLDENNALSVIAGYTILNDVTNRDLQQARGQWFMGKSADYFGPLGPWLVTADEIENPHGLDIFQRVNGETLQQANTSQMIFRLEQVLADLSQVMTLQPGDVVSTGTPGGIGSARKPPQMLHDGDVVECEVEGIGILRNLVNVQYI
ncbi:MAG: fumarylacetoacetate hydrolase family protein [Verrucomicrobiota bacterium]|jgi:2-keto-4-pentenoate hydratase/2-oxohepta-3-ene-1,7-dioic acid hydratase in catechol pathway|nr:fumarylacetoacetate hydrolase family protein [Verrucomicrobiota bacterium]